MSEMSYGGQAVMEGVMMRGAKAVVVAVRAPNGQIVSHSQPLNQAIYSSWIARVPFVRGITMLWDSLVLGTRSLMFSADIAIQDERGSADPAEPAESVFSTPLAWGSMIVSLALALGLFFVLPALLTRVVDRYIASSLLSHFIEGLIRLAIVLGYIWAVGQLPDIRRVFAYHGAEHKAVHAYEHGEALTVAGVRRHTTSHERCGTSFILVVVVISMLVFALFGRPTLLWRIVLRIVLIPVIVGISYEWLKFAAKYRDRWWVQVLLAPGLLMQRLTTREPDDDMIEVALVALRQMLEAEGLPVPTEGAAATEATG
ncbi:MAG: DUF1385 domain-containing protein [Anaerolineae bacterium]|nr:DUF1385 domain-containing protein [Anaerolineae bacterium]